jgi:hypothetical protein
MELQKLPTNHITKQQHNDKITIKHPKIRFSATVKVVFQLVRYVLKSINI